MSFLPIVQRELRTAAQRTGTFRIRWWTALIALGVCSLWFASVELSHGRMGPGRPLFSLLTGYAFGLCLLAGVFLTADSLSEEKREGTLGLLFLTDLKGYDVVLGKFSAMGLNSFYGLLTLVPITALPLLLGGVTGGEFWRTALALANALFFSLAAGICVSAFARDSQRAMGNALGLILLFAAALPILARFVSQTRLPLAWQPLAWVSPFYPFSYAAEMLYMRPSAHFWASLGVSHLLGWALLGLASAALPHTWQEKNTRASRGHRQGRPTAWRARPRGGLLSGNPMQWLVSGDLTFQWRAWVIALAGGTTLLITLLFLPGKPHFSAVNYYVALPFGFLLKVLFALQACRFFVEARRQGSLELLLCTPLTSAEIVRGQMVALWCGFLWPLAVFFAFWFVPVGISATTELFRSNIKLAVEAGMGSFVGLFFWVRMAADLFAVSWFGMGLALTIKKPGLAPGLTILLVLILPSIVSFCFVDLLLDIFFIAWGAGKCQQDLRRLLARQYQTSYANPAPVPPSLREVPPVIGG